MAEAPSISVVIPSWNRLGELQECLVSLRAQQGVGVEPFIVDNGSEDGTGEFLREAGVPHLALPSNHGFAAAVNLGLARTTAPLVMVLNQDTLLEPDCLSMLCSALEADPTVGGVQPLILQLEPVARDAEAPETVVYSHGQSLTPDGRAREDGAGRPRSATRIEPREIFGVCGAACLLRRELTDALGGYDESYFAFYEDVDLNVRARIAGWRFLLAPDAFVWHIGNAAWRAGFERPAAANSRLVARNRLATQIKFMPVRSIPRIAAVEVGSLARAISQRRLGATLKGKFETLGRFPSLLRERRRLRGTGQPERARAWLGVGWEQGRVGTDVAAPGAGGPSRPEAVRSDGAGRYLRAIPAGVLRRSIDRESGSLSLKLRGLAKRAVRHPQWAVESARLARGRGRMEAEFDAFRLAAFEELIGGEPEVMASVLGISTEEYRRLASELWTPHEPGHGIELWDARDALLRIVGVVVRVLRPERMVETGVARGRTTATALAAMAENEKGHLHSVDLPPLAVDRDFIGQAVPEELRDRWTLHVGPSRFVLPKVVAEAAPIDVFLHDSDNTYGSMLEEYRTAWPKIRSGGLLLSDDVANRSLTDFATEVGVTPQLILREGNSAFGVLAKP
jgi:GT2 family glycosyltransferase